MFGEVFSSKSFKGAKQYTAGRANVNAKTFNFIDFSLGKNEDKMIKIIRTPPVNSRVKIRGNQDVPVLTDSKAMMAKLKPSRLTANFIGPRE